MDITDLTEGAMDALDLKEREKVLGLPIGRKKINWSKVAKIGAGTAIVAGGAVAAKKFGGKLVGLVREATDEATDTLGDLTDTGQDLLEGGESLVETASEQISSLGNGFAVLDKLKGAVSSIGSIGSDENGDLDGSVTKARLIVCEQIEVGVPRRVAYNQWTQFEDMPEILGGVESVEQEDDDRTHWVGKIAFFRREWDAHITEQIPDERIAWESEDGLAHRGVVTFHSIDDNLTRIQVEMEYHPSGLLERIGSLLHVGLRVWVSIPGTDT
jgi:hypothetical protein